ncbi:hypothetical protein [Nannocystis sp.]|uniref:hypothetical protein n=1 Tax=Nannocystis sp. TaxID=1962667 RepID=UPI002423F956|nr:hypothetical protein [Nannocystis sp.]MBK7826885.1 hypothetical protein [Nannocystis sp.]MBK9756080.1 hypothetical protein [Nannocystis sp.]
MSTSPPTKRPAAGPLLGLLPEARWARVHKVQLIRREIRETLSPSALEVLWRYGEHVVEGGEELGGGSPQRRFYATVMVTFDLRRCAAYFREPADVATAERLAELMIGSTRVQKKLVALARPELARMAKVAEACLHIEMDHHARAEGTQVLIDGDAMVTLEPARKAGLR